MDNFLNLITTQGEAIFGSLWPLVWALVRIVIIVLPMFGCVAYLTLWERKLIGWMHIRLGPNRVGPLGLLQPIADALKLLMKEIISPAQASKPPTYTRSGVRREYFVKRLQVSYCSNN